MTATAQASGVRDNTLRRRELAAKLARTWAPPRGLIGSLLSSVDHKIVGRRYIITAFIFLVLGGLSALVMRLQLARPDSDLVGPDF